MPTILNNLAAFLIGGDGAPDYAPNGLLAARKLAVEQLANASGVTRTAIYTYITGDSRPTAPVLRKICESLGVRFEEGLKFCTPSTIGRPPYEAPPVPPNRAVHLADRRQANRVATAFSIRLLQLMQQHDPPIGIRDFAEGIGVVYEHARKILHGGQIPSDRIIPTIACFLGADEPELLTLAKRDRIQQKFGDIPEVGALNPDLDAFAEAWPVLTADQKNFLKLQLKMFVQINGRSTVKEGIT
jgi:transcriptional regulator with XRE-family HTH domain